MVNMDKETLERVICHIFLPPKLPQSEDVRSETDLPTIALKAIEDLKKSHGDEFPDNVLDNTIFLLQSICSINKSGRVDEVVLQQCLKKLPTSRTIAVHVSAQNAAILITRHEKDLVFECFELAPPNESVMKTKGRLVRTFPDIGINVAAEKLFDEDFATAISSTIAKMSFQVVPQLQAKSNKSGVDHPEDRDSTSPAIVSGLLFGMLSGIGSAPNTKAITKRTREDILWNQTARPWRRSPMWLLLRVAIQLVVERSDGGTREMYKKIVVRIMAFILERAQTQGFSMDDLYIMEAKICRRLLKLEDMAGAAQESILITSIHSILVKSHDHLTKRWLDVQKRDSDQARLDLSALRSLKFHTDALISPLELDDHLAAMNKRVQSQAGDVFTSASNLVELSDECWPLPNILDLSKKLSEAEKIANLYELEDWVAWVFHSSEPHAADTTIFGKAHRLARAYHEYACICYRDNPEAWSSMLLTIFSLFAICDRAAIRVCPLLADYNLDVPIDALQNLLLPQKRQMQQLLEIEQHFESRCGRYASALLFSTSDKNAFAVRFFENSTTHQDLLEEITIAGQKGYTAKMNEFARKRNEYDRLKTRAASIDHETRVVVLDTWCNPPETEIEHVKKCEKCHLEKLYDSITIDIHEWPISQNTEAARTTVFELAVPEFYAHWREFRHFLLSNVLHGKHHRKASKLQYSLSKDRHLSKRFRMPSFHRIGLFSETKLAKVTHYKIKNLSSVTSRELCVPNGSKYSFYDSETKILMGTITFDGQIQSSCTFQPSSAALRSYVFRPAFQPDGPMPNKVIAQQNNVPKSMSLEEYRNLATLPLGHHIQWLNIGVQLASPSINFKSSNTAAVILQCIYQAGPRNGQVIRAAHDVIKDNAIATQVLASIRLAVQSLQANWESAASFGLFSAIVTRVLSLNARMRVHCFSVLADIRNITFTWIPLLAGKADLAKKDEDRTDFLAHGVQVALVCASTFDVDEEYLGQVLDDPRNVSVLIQATIAVQEGSENVKKDNVLLTLMRRRVTCLLHKARAIISQCPQGIDDAIQNVWASYQPSGEDWTEVVGSHKQWITTTTAGTSEAQSLTVHLNILDGQLLVDGIPLHQPPIEYRKMENWSNLFGDAVIRVLPATVSGFRFSTKKTIAGFKVQLGISASDDASDNASDTLIVQATRDADTFELLPSKLFDGVVPTKFWQEYIYWYHTTTEQIEARPVDEPWTSDASKIWVLERFHDQAWSMRKGDKRLVGLHTPTSRAISLALRAITAEPDTTILYSPDSKELQIEIPSLRLRFSLSQKTNLLMSKDHASMYLDSDQNFGCLAGLTSKLVLRNADNKRLLLVPESSALELQRDGDHVFVSVSREKPFGVHAYWINELLDRLEDTYELHSRLYLAYLYALTSSCLPDPLTCRTGTESALAILSSSLVFSEQQLAPNTAELLKSIAKLSPKRNFYPENEKSMQTVKWNSELPSLSQHGWFDAKVKLIREHYDRQNKIFQPGLSSSASESKNSLHLSERGMIRSASFRISGFGAEDHTAKQDETYVTRCLQPSIANNDVAFITALINKKAETACYALPYRGVLWQALNEAYKLSNVQTDMTPGYLVYDAKVISKAEGYHKILLNFSAFCRMLRQFATKRKYSIMAFMACLSFADDRDLAILHILVMFMQSNALQELSPPSIQGFNPPKGTVADMKDITELVHKHIRPFETSPDYSLPRNANEARLDYENRRRILWQIAKESVATTFVQDVMQQWPTCNVTTPTKPADLNSYIDRDAVMVEIRTRFIEWHGNLLLWQYFDRIENVMSGFPQQAVHIPTTGLGKSAIPCTNRCFIAERSLFDAPPVPTENSICPNVTVLIEPEHTKDSPRTDMARLNSLIATLGGRLDTGYGRKYIDNLQLSCDALSSKDRGHDLGTEITHETLEDYLTACSDYKELCYNQILDSVRNGSSTTACSVQLEPRLSTQFFLSQLNRHNWSGLSDAWKEALVRFGLAITAFQQAKRLVRLLSSGQSLTAELSNPGHLNWDPMEAPEELLIEIEGNILIREIQTQVGVAMKNPSKGVNSTVQLNMGEGKTSVLVPTVAISVANTSRLPTVIVGKAQSKQMADMLRTRLGGLLDRRIYFMPFSRSLNMNLNAVKVVLDMLRECIATGSILLFQPEHVLSFQLMAAENHLRGKHQLGLLLSGVQDLLDEQSRYIVDECDENFSVRFELIYSVGTPSLIDGGSSRWTLIQEILRLVRDLLPSVAKTFPEKIDVRTGAKGSFPKTHIFHEDASRMLVGTLAKFICDNGVEGLPIARQSAPVRRDIYKYMTKRDIPPEAIDRVERSSFWTDSTKGPLMLLRGLLAGGILAFVFDSKRWRVHYGSSDRSPRTRLAVPYKAKDCPSFRSEFSHPDVVILLTSLTFYYGGLSDEDLFTAFSHLRLGDEPDAEYAMWTKDADSLSPEFLQLQGVNIKDRLQCVDRVFPALKYSKGAIDYFLGKLVFPKEMKEFPKKLSASGWDLSKVKSCVTTGFSGTNDSQHTLPLMMRHVDLLESAHTNALVLDYLLQPQNAIELMSNRAHVDNDAQYLLDTVTSLQPPVQVIIDVGAQVVEETSENFAKKWLLHSNSSKEAIVFVDVHDVIQVLDRRGRVELLQSSPFASRLCDCLVFLDEAHTRGIDLKLPINYRAAVTLGARLTKDNLVQACMRMRQLGMGQTVVFCIREEIQRKIRAATKMHEINVESILTWTMTEFLAELRRNVPLWATQGERFYNHAKVWQECKTTGKTVMNLKRAEKFLENEAQTIEQRYCPKRIRGQMTLSSSASSTSGADLIRARCLEVDDLDYNSTTLQEEQERELAAEIEQERQVERPLPATAAPHKLHRLVEQFALTGIINDNHQEVFKPAFNSLRGTQAAAKYPMTELSANCSLLVTRDFAQTVLIPKNNHSDNYQRSVQWVLTSCKANSNLIEKAVIISPFEANLLYTRVKHSTKTTLHLFKARCNVRHPSLDDLNFCTISGRRTAAVFPRRLAVELALFAGQTYITSFDDYKMICDLLGLATDSSALKVDADGFIEQDASGRRGGKSGLSKSPVSLMQALMSTIRRDGEPIVKTHMGRVLAGQMMREDDFKNEDA